jgi:hypothetical protein
LVLALGEVTQKTRATFDYIFILPDVPYTVQEDDMFAIAESHSCFINRTDTLNGVWYKQCSTTITLATFRVFVVGYADGPQVPNTPLDIEALVSAYPSRQRLKRSRISAAVLTCIAETCARVL